jgi:hypothetical protein
VDSTTGSGTSSYVRSGHAKRQQQKGEARRDLRNCGAKPSNISFMNVYAYKTISCASSTIVRAWSGLSAVDSGSSPNSIYVFSCGSLVGLLQPSLICFDSSIRIFHRVLMDEEERIHHLREMSFTRSCSLERERDNVCCLLS